MEQPLDFDTRVKVHIYETIAETTRPPLRAETARALDASEPEVAGAYDRLKGRRLLALAPESGEIVMAPPFAAGPTAFQFKAGDKAYFANCVWDVYGIAAALHQDGDIVASCGCCGEPAQLGVREGRPLPSVWIAHFAVPARNWWDDITFT
jgi:hypothetical protein